MSHVHTNNQDEESDIELISSPEGGGPETASTDSNTEEVSDKEQDASGNGYQCGDDTLQEGSDG